METKAVQILQARLEEEGGSASITSLSVKVKWGQHELQGFGHIRKFLSKHHEVFSLDGSSVTLVKTSDKGQKTTSKSSPTKPPATISQDAQKRVWVADAGPNKAARINPQTEQTELPNGGPEVEARKDVSMAMAKPTPKSAMAPTPKAAKTAIAPTPKGSPQAKDSSDGFAQPDAVKSTFELAPWHAQRALSRAAAQAVQASPRQDQ